MSDLSFLDFMTDLDSPGVATAHDEVSLWSAMFGLLMLEEIPLAGIRTALDVGCGTGFPLIELAERLGAAADVHGVDVWAGGLSRAAEKIQARGTPNVTLHTCDAVELPFADASFDLVVSNVGINNFEDRPAVLVECRRVLRTGGTIALTTNPKGHMQELYTLFEELLRHDDDALERLAAHVAHRATAREVASILDESGFTVRRIVERQQTMRFATGTAFLDHYFIKLGFLDGWRSIVDAAEHRSIFTALRRRLDEISTCEGEVRMTIPLAYVEASAT
ncbi:MAG: methyltransferase domain-containing protein [Thermoanaerobaculia bacterium]